MTKTLLVIDDSQGFREAITLAGEEKQWVVFTTNDLKEIREYLREGTPDRVLLDWQLPGQQRKDFLELLKEHLLTACTLLISFTDNDERQQFVADHGLAGFRLKPLDLDRLDEEIELSEQPARANWPGLDVIVNGIEVAVNILDGNLNSRWSNQKAKENLLETIHQRLIVKWLQAEMEGNNSKAARRLDWDGDKNCFLESRLFHLNDGGGYWLARDWRVPGDKPHDHEILNLESDSDLDAWFHAVAKLLAQRYAISRLRVYKVTSLRDIGKTNSVLIMPLFQSGGGFEQGKDEIWLRSGFLADQTNPLMTEALKPNYEPKPEPADDVNRNDGCQFIRYGEKGTSRVLFPVRIQENRVSSLLALDRRLDHVNTLSGNDKDVVEIAKRMASDDAGVLTDEQWSLMKGLVSDLGNRLDDRLTIDERERSRRWHKNISKAIKSIFAEASRSPEMIYKGLNQVCAALVEAWSAEKTSGRIMGITPWAPAEKPAPPLSAWYISLLVDEAHWQAVAGWGDLYSACRYQGLHVLIEPHCYAKNTDPWQAVAIQDFPAWSQNRAQTYRNIESKVSSVGSWLAIPMQIDGTVRALMVVHSPHRYYFSEFRISLLENAAERLLPILAAALRESRARSAFAASIMHELKNDAHAAILLLEKLKDNAACSEWKIPLDEIYLLLEGLEALGQDSMDIFKLGLDARNRSTPSNDQEDKVTNLGELIEKTTSGWKLLYVDTRFEADIPEKLKTIKVSSSLKRVLRILLHNAFRHGVEWVRVKIAMEAQSESPDCTRLEISVKNLAFKDVIKRVEEICNPADGGTSSSPYIRAHLGLQLAHQLSVEAGGDLGNFEFPSTNDSEDQVEVAINLYWPVFTAND